MAAAGGGEVDFEFVWSEKRNKNLLKIRSQRTGPGQEEFEGRSYLFAYKDHHGIWIRYRCLGCDHWFRVRHVPGRRAVVCERDGRLKLGTDPDANHHPQCRPGIQTEIVARQVERTMVREVVGGAKPSDARSAGMKNLAESARQGGCDYDDLADKVKPDHKMERRFRKNVRKGLPAVNEWMDLPEEYLVSLRGRPDEFGHDDHRGERWLQLAQEQPDILFFMTDTEALLIATATALICDGTFSKTPREFTRGGQIYTILIELNGETVVVGTAIMRQRTIEAYRAVFQTILDRIWALRPGHPLRLERILMDFVDA